MLGSINASVSQSISPKTSPSMDSSTPMSPACPCSLVIWHAAPLPVARKLGEGGGGGSMVNPCAHTHHAYIPARTFRGDMVCNDRLGALHVDFPPPQHQFTCSSPLHSSLSLSLRLYPALEPVARVWPCSCGETQAIAHPSAISAGNQRPVAGSLCIAPRARTQRGI